MQKINTFLIGLCLLHAPIVLSALEVEPGKEHETEEERGESYQKITQSPPPISNTTEPQQTQEETQGQITSPTTASVPSLLQGDKASSENTNSISVITDESIRNILQKPASLARIDPSLIGNYLTKHPEDLITIIQPATVEALDISSISMLSKIIQEASLSNAALSDLLVTLFNTTATLMESGQKEVAKVTLLNDALAQKISTKNNPLTQEQKVRIEGAAARIASILRKTFTTASSSILALSKAILTTLYSLFFDTSATKQAPSLITKDMVDTAYVRSRKQIYDDFYEEAQKERQGEFSQPALVAEKKQRARLAELNRAYELVEQYVHFTAK